MPKLTRILQKNYGTISNRHTHTHTLFKLSIRVDETGMWDQAIIIIFSTCPSFHSSEEQLCASEIEQEYVFFYWKEGNTIDVPFGIRVYLLNPTREVMLSFSKFIIVLSTGSLPLHACAW